MANNKFTYIISFGVCVILLGIVIVGAGHFFDTPGIRRADGSKAYMPMERTVKNSLFDLFESQVDAYINHHGISVNTSVDFPELPICDRYYRPETNTVLTEIPAIISPDISSSSQTAIMAPDGLVMVDMTTGNPGYSWAAWFEINSYDRNGISSLYVWEVDEKNNPVRVLLLLPSPGRDLMAPKRKIVAIKFTPEGMGSANRLRVDIIDNKLNEYQSYITLERI